ncbi:MAG: PQQ-like beta-propeller repeat protein, partial [Planctomycetes bacterium]|nr:PQQ-like beta-propeller repeat protein [Planctomycetota bacterium]
MKAAALRSLLLSLGLVVSGGDDSRADSAAPFRWGGSSSPNSVSSARGLPTDLEGREPMWALRLGTHQYSIPTVDRGRIYIGINDTAIERSGVPSTGGGILMCLDQATGRMLWQLPSPRYFDGVKEPYHYNQWKCGFCSGPVVDGDRVYAVGGRGEVLCLDREGQANGNDGPFLDELEYMQVENAAEAALLPADGDIIWRFDFLKELDAVPHDVCGSTLLLAGDFLYACTSNGVDGKHAYMPRPDAPSLVVLDKRTGRLVAREGEKIGHRTLHGQWSSPSCGVVGGRMLIFFGGGDGILYAFEPPRPAGEAVEGAAVQILRKVWSCDCNPEEYRVRDGQPIPYSRHNRKREDGPSEIIGTPVFHEGRVYAAIGQSPLHGPGRGQLSCVDAATGGKIWASRLVDRSLATVSIAGGLLYIADFSGNLHCFDAASGERCWVHELGA